MGIIDAQKATRFKKGAIDTRSFYRLGIGLSLAKRLVKSYDGKIWIEDRVDGDYTKGSKFNILIKEFISS